MKRYLYIKINERINEPAFLFKTQKCNICDKIPIVRNQSSFYIRKNILLHPINLLDLMGKVMEPLSNTVSCEILFLMDIWRYHFLPIWESRCIRPSIDSSCTFIYFIECSMECYLLSFTEIFFWGYLLTEVRSESFGKQDSVELMVSTPTISIAILTSLWLKGSPIFEPSSCLMCDTTR